jgi:glutamate--cysteine ligase
VARDVLAIAREGLNRRNRLSGSLSNESSYLSDLEEIVDTGLTPAERLLELYNGAWDGEATSAFDATAY